MGISKISLTLRVLAALLSYPSERLRGELSALVAALREEAALPAARQREIELLIARLRHIDALDCESEYVEVFDRGRATSLHLFEHVHGDSRDRGPALIDLAQTYEARGLILAPGELPDYLPVALEFASTLPAEEARAFLREMAHILNAISNALQKRESPYAAITGALLDLCGKETQTIKVVDDEPLDATWEEPAVFDGCSSRGQAASEQPIHLVRNATATRQTSPSNPHIPGVSP